MSSLNKKHFCEQCGDRIFRRGFRVNDKLYCRSCMYALFSESYNELEYTRIDEPKCDKLTDKED